MFLFRFLFACFGLFGFFVYFSSNRYKTQKKGILYSMVRVAVPDVVSLHPAGVFHQSNMFSWSVFKIKE